MQRKVKISLTKKRWDALIEIFQSVIQQTPVPMLETESCLISEYYFKNIQRFTFFSPNNKNEVVFTFKKSEAYAFYYIVIDGRFTKPDPPVICFVTQLQLQLKIGL